jgi:hypothetical protein
LPAFGCETRLLRHNCTTTNAFLLLTLVIRSLSKGVSQDLGSIKARPDGMITVQPPFEDLSVLSIDCSQLYLSSHNHLDHLAQPPSPTQFTILDIQGRYLIYSTASSLSSTTSSTQSETITTTATSSDHLSFFTISS